MKFSYSVFQIDQGTSEIGNSSYQYWIILGGNGQITWQEQTWVITAHDMIDIPSDCVLKIYAESDLSIGKITLTDFYATNTKVIHYVSSQTELLRKTFYYGLELTGTPHPHKKHLMNLLDQIMAEILFSMPYEKMVQSPFLFGLIDQLNDNFTSSDLHIGELLETTGYSPAYVRRIFLKEVGVTPVEFLNNRRIERAKELLKKSERNLPIKEIAERSGYLDPYYFSRIFKKSTGLTPGAYRKAHWADADKK